MRRILIALMLLISVSAFADEATLIDFTKLKAAEDGENAATTLDYSAYLMSSPVSTNTKISLAMNNWSATINASSRTYEVQRSCLVREAPSTSSGSVLGVRVNFPDHDYNSYAEILPPFEIPVYNDQNVDFTQGLGVIRNISLIKSISINVYGRNNPHELVFLLKDQDDRIIEVNFGSLQFSGWKKLTWENPSYIEDVKDRELVSVPDYPGKGATYVKFFGFILKRNSIVSAGDSIFYVKDISMIYDKLDVSTDSDFDDDAIWKIVEERELARNREEMIRIAKKIELLRLEQMRMHK